VLKLLLPLLPQLLEQVLQARHALPLTVLGSLAEQVAQGIREVAILQQVIAHGIQERLGVEVEPLL
jgi:hypothetical protein